jgi:tRNA-specific 2-thiouridylase
MARYEEVGAAQPVGRYQNPQPAGRLASSRGSAASRPLPKPAASRPLGQQSEIRGQSAATKPATSRPLGQQSEIDDNGIEKLIGWKAVLQTAWLPARPGAGYAGPTMHEADLQQYCGKTIAVGMSGGIDSSLVLVMLHEAGATVSGLTMKIWRPGALPLAPGNGDACYGPGEEEDIAACTALCASLGVPYHVIDLSAAYEERILGYFRREYQSGRTPNPCVRCNQELKFGFLLERARASGVDFSYFATGHYARIMPRQGIPTLHQAVDLTKDQTYFIHRLSATTLAQVIFPLGAMTKTRARELARQYHLDMADKPESQDFVSGDYGALFDGIEPGDIVDQTGKVVGRHRGIVHYTIGQRRGLGIGGSAPLYVAAIDAVKNRIIVSADTALFAERLAGTDPVLHAPDLMGKSFKACVRIRQNHRPATAMVTVEHNIATVDFDIPQRAVAPGQSAVFYDAEGFVLGGCIIEKALQP